MRFLATALLVFVTVHVAAQDKYACVVGVEAYDTGTFDALDYANEDAHDLGESLSAIGFFTKVMTSDASSSPLRPATPQKILRVMKATAASCGPGDTLLISLSGHGVQFADEPPLESGVRETYFCPEDADLSDKSTLLRISEVMEFINQSRASRKLLLVDACRESVLSDRGKSKSAKRIDLGSIHENRESVPSGMAVLFSCSSKQFSWEHQDLKHSVFTNYVIDYLSGKAETRFYSGGTIDLDGLVYFVRKRTNEFVSGRNLSADGQAPVLRGESANWPLGDLRSRPASASWQVYSPDSYEGALRIQLAAELVKEAKSIHQSNAFRTKLQQTTFTVESFDGKNTEIREEKISDQQVQQALQHLESEISRVESGLRFVTGISRGELAIGETSGHSSRRDYDDGSRYVQMYQPSGRLHADLLQDFERLLNEDKPDYSTVAGLGQNAADLLARYSINDFDRLLSRLPKNSSDLDGSARCTKMVLAAFAGNQEEVRILSQKPPFYTHRPYWVVPFVIRDENAFVRSVVGTTPDMADMLLFIIGELVTKGKVSDDTFSLVNSMSDDASGALLVDQGGTMLIEKDFYWLLGTLKQRSAFTRFANGSSDLGLKAYANLAFARGLLWTIDY
ncbi:caspase family protein [Stieleria varia]|uniref:Caspase domain protein n=1 Tax=Stieleria varia TaxID=2528005 RepID=A0A5C6B408_9BACT|nr:caspase family protein [Stieleria varia]TWU06016.1 Caspase domain protein [Stieleria varia]